MSGLRERYDQVKIGLPEHVTLVAVSKTRSVEEIQAVYDLGQRHFGENKAQEIKDKAPLLPKDIQWHFIGHLQRNKVKYVVPFADLIHSIDSMRLLDEVNERAHRSNKVQDVLLQVSIAAEAAKFGMPVEQVREIIDSSSANHSHIRIRGLMGMATFTEDNTQITQEFEMLSDLFISIKADDSLSLSQFDTLSMGMSGDANIAIACGSTMVRIGTAIFGKRG